MTVAELIEELKKLPPESKVILQSFANNTPIYIDRLCLDQIAIAFLYLSRGL